MTAWEVLRGGVPRLWPARSGRLHLTARHGVLTLFCAATLLLLAAGTLVSRALLTNSLDGSMAREAGREARLTADMGLAAALSSGRISPRDLRLAASEYAVARRDSPLIGLALWAPSGRMVMVRGSGRSDARSQRLPKPARTALRTGRTEVQQLSDPRHGATIAAYVPLGRSGLDAVAEFHYSRTGLERNLDRAKRHLYLVTVVAAAVLYLAVLPLLAWLARRLPLPVDRSRRAAAGELRSAIARNELVLHYQPKIDASSGAAIGVEALVRWNHPSRGLLGPGAFLPAAESNPELMAEITWRVLELAVADCAGWLREGRELPVAVNVPASVVPDGSLTRAVRETLERHGVPAHLLTVELTEGALMEEKADLTEALAELRELGVSISIDDFGTGYSSLARLRSLPLDELKIDRAFIAGLTSDERDLGITSLIIELGLKLDLRIVAEGVEDRATAELLRGLGCPAFQGFLFSRPVPPAELREVLRRPAPLTA
jgi:EAL domain-containing protein (putative c-di-GMP-specific phosphodiesterase class I)